MHKIPVQPGNLQALSPCCTVCQLTARSAPRQRVMYTGLIQMWGAPKEFPNLTVGLNLREKWAEIYHELINLQNRRNKTWARDDASFDQLKSLFFFLRNTGTKRFCLGFELFNWCFWNKHSKIERSGEMLNVSLLISDQLWRRCVIYWAVSVTCRDVFLADKSEHMPHCSLPTLVRRAAASLLFNNQDTRTCSSHLQISS